MKGTIKKWIDAKGFGFIDGEDGESYFLHISQLPQNSQPKEGDRVKFNGVDSDRGKQAQRAEIIN